MVPTISDTKTETPSGKPSRKLAKFDLLLLVTLTSIFLVCLGLNMKMVFGDGSPLTTIAVEIGDGPDDLPVVVFFQWNDAVMITCR
jgi:hypothetical protein